MSRDIRKELEAHSESRLRNIIKNGAKEHSLHNSWSITHDLKTKKDLIDHIDDMSNEHGLKLDKNHKFVKEDAEDNFEQLDELSKETLKNYIDRAVDKKDGGHQFEKHLKTMICPEKFTKKQENLSKGIKQAAKKLTKEEVDVSLLLSSVIDSKPIEFVDSVYSLFDSKLSTALDGIRHDIASNLITVEESDTPWELEIHANNNQHLYKSSYVPIAKSLEKKFKAGKYDHEKAKKLWGYHVNRSAPSYNKAYGKTLSTTDRKAAAKIFADHHYIEMKAGNFHESVEYKDIEEFNDNILNEISKKTLGSYILKAGESKTNNTTSLEKAYKTRRAIEDSGIGRNKTELKKLTNEDVD